MKGSEPYRPSRCRFHPRREAVCWSKVGSGPGQLVCEECFQKAREAYEGGAP